MVAAGFLALPKEETATLLANTDAFQASTGAANPTAARDFIFIYEDEPEEKDFYCIISDHPSAGRFERIGAGGGTDNFRWTKGTTFAFFRKVASFGEATAEAFDNEVSAILEGMLVLQGSGVYRRIDEIAPLRTDSPDLLMKFQRDTDTGIVYEYGRAYTESFIP